jgi:D-amino-acid oxidase
VSVQRVVVVGAGVVGLTCAVRLAEAGHPVDVLARDLPAETSSAVAGGLWLPPVDPTPDMVRRARRGLEELTALAVDPSSGVRLLPGELLGRRAAAEPAWFAPLRDVVAPTPVAQPPVGLTRAWAATLPVADMGSYLEHLTRRLAAAGGSVTRLPLPALPGRGLVVNCTGIAARMLAPDPSVRPVRTQVVVLEDAGLDRWWCDADDSDGDVLTVVPRGRDVVVGACVEDGGWDPVPDPRAADAILARASTVLPQVGSLRVKAHRVCIRPTRPTVRVEVEHRVDDDGNPSPVVHCYGHGGAGLTLSWGCADDVTALVAGLTQTAAVAG